MGRFGGGFAAGADLLHAAERAVAGALGPLAGRTPDLGVVFVSAADPGQGEDALLRATRLTRARNTVGALAPGVIGAGRAVEGASAVSVWAAVLPEVTVRTFHLEVIRTERGMVVVGLPEAPPDGAVIVLLADPYSFPADGFVAQANEMLPGVGFIGGLAPGALGAGSSRLLVDERTVSRGAVGALLCGPVGARTLVSQGCRPVGPPMVVTRSEGATLLELAGAPALSRLEAVLATLPPADQALASAGLQIGVAVSERDEEPQAGDFVVRGIAAGDRATGGLVVGDLVQVGRTVRLQVPDAASAAAQLTASLAELAAAPGFDTVDAALLFSCVGRGRALFGEAAHDARAIQRAFGPVPVAGCFAAGEIAPLAGRNQLHGMTACLLLFGSGPAAARGTAP